MFDYIKSDYPLPITDEIKESLGKQEWEEISFQTKSFPDAWCETYTIEEDGQIYREKVVRELVESAKNIIDVKEIPDGIEKLEWSGEVVFYHSFRNDDSDFWIEFKALVWKGDLKEIELVDFRPTENESRKEMEKKFSEATMQRIKKENKWWWTYFKAWCWIVKVPLVIFRWIVGLLIRITYKLERWLTGGKMRF